MTGTEQLSAGPLAAGPLAAGPMAAGPLAEASSMQSSILPPPEALQGKKLRLGKKVPTQRVVAH